MPTYQIWIHSGLDTLGIATEDECSEMIVNDPEVELLNTFETIEEADIAARAYANEYCLDYKPIN